MHLITTKKNDLNSYHCAFNNWTASSVCRLQLKTLKGKKLFQLFFHYLPKQLRKLWKSFFSADLTGGDVPSSVKDVTVGLTRWIQWAQMFSAMSVELAQQQCQLSSLKSVQGYWALQKDVLFKQVETTGTVMCLICYYQPHWLKAVSKQASEIRWFASTFQPWDSFLNLCS